MKLIDELLEGCRREFVQLNQNYLIGMRAGIKEFPELTTQEKRTITHQINNYLDVIRYKENK